MARVRLLWSVDLGRSLGSLRCRKNIGKLGGLAPQKAKRAMLPRMGGALRCAGARALRRQRGRLSSSFKSEGRRRASGTGGSGSDAQAQSGGGGFVSLVFATALTSAIAGFMGYKYKEREVENQNKMAGSPDPAPREIEAQSAQEKRQDATTPSAPPAPKAAAQELTPPAVAEPRDDIGRSLYAEFRRFVEADRDPENIAGLRPKTKLAPDGSVAEIAGKRLPLKDIGEANEVIVLLEALNRGLQARIEEDGKVAQYKENVFRKLAPVFTGEVGRLLAELSAEAKGMREAELEQRDREVVKLLAMQMEQQKHALFQDYQQRVEAVKAGVDGRFSDIISQLRGAADEKIKGIESAAEKSKAERIQALRHLDERSTGLFKMLKHAVANQKRSRQAWTLGVHLLSVQSALNTSGPFADEWHRLLEASKGDRVLQTAILAVPPEIAAQGVPTTNELKTRYFDQVETAGREALLVDTARGPTGNVSFWAFPLAKIVNRLLVRGPSDDPGQTIMTKATDLVSAGDLTGAASELDNLTGSAGDVVKDWVRDTRARMLVEQTLSIARARISHQDVVDVDQRR